MSDEDRACIDFFNSSSMSIEEEPAYFGRLAMRIRELGHEQAGTILADVASQWEVGRWEPQPGDETPEAMISALMAEAGGLLASAGHLRCADLAEFWGIDGYRGEPTDRELFERQLSIWIANEIGDYRLLVKVPSGSVNPIQYHIEVVEGQPTRVLDAMTGERLAVIPPNVPLTVDEMYGQMAETGQLASIYDLVFSVPTNPGRISVSFDPYEFPAPQEENFEES